MKSRVATCFILILITYLQHINNYKSNFQHATFITNWKSKCTLQIETSATHAYACCCHIKILEGTTRQTIHSVCLGSP